MDSNREAIAIVNTVQTWFANSPGTKLHMLHAIISNKTALAFDLKIIQHKYVAALSWCEIAWCVWMCRCWF